MNKTLKTLCLSGALGIYSIHKVWYGCRALGSPWASSSSPSTISWLLLMPVLGLSPPCRQVPPITLIGGRDVVLSVAGCRMAAVYPVDHRSSCPLGPRFQGRDATTSKNKHKMTSFLFEFYCGALYIYVQVTRTGVGRVEGIGLLVQGDQSGKATETRWKKNNTFLFTLKPHIFS